MKKRYIASPILIIALAAAWNIGFRSHTPVATAEDVRPYISPQTTDPRHPIEVFVVPIDGGETQSAVLAQLPTTIYPEDKVSFIVDPALGLGTIVHIQRALLVTIIDGKKTVTVRTWDNTVGELLDDVNRTLGDLDKSNYKESDLLITNMTIAITRVAKTNVTQKEVIAFDTIDKDDPTMDRPQTKVSQPGANGERTKVFEVTREDGVEVSRKLLSNVVSKTPQSKIVLHGTRVKIGKVASGKATFYDSSRTKVAANVFKKGTVLRLTNLNNGKQIEVTVDDSGGFSSDVVVDLNPALFQQLGGTIGQGVLQNVKAEEILNP